MSGFSWKGITASPRHVIFMSRHLWAMLFLFPVFSAAAGNILQTGGSNVVAIDIQPERLLQQEDWKKSDVFRTPACQYAETRKDLEGQLKAMRDSGQKKIALVLWFAHLKDDKDCAGFLLNSTGGHFTSKVVSNLSQVVASAQTLGFDEIQIRFAPMGKNWPHEWKRWEQELYTENWSVIESTISALARLQGPRIVYDLGVELGGLTAPGCEQCEIYVQRLWAQFINAFPTQDSYGFSVAIGPGRIATLLKDLRKAGRIPTEVAIDTYDPKHPGIKITVDEMRAAGMDLPILIQETLYNDAEMNEALRAQAKTTNARIRAIMQWPRERGAQHQISEPSTPKYPYSP